MLQGLRGLFGTQTPEEAQAQARKEQALADQYGFDMLGVEQPFLDPIDMAGSGAAVMSRGLLTALANAGSDAVFSLALEHGVDHDADYLKAVYLGKRGMKTLGLDASRDLAGQFSGLHDKLVRMEVDNPALTRPLTKQDEGQYFYPSEVSTDLGPNKPITRAYPKLDEDLTVKLDSELIPDEGVFSPKSDTISLGPIRPGSRTEAGKQQMSFDHELQHFIDKQEGFPRGGDPLESWTALRSKINRSTDLLKRAHEDAEINMMHNPSAANKAKAAEAKTAYYDAVGKANEMIARIKSGSAYEDSYDNYWRMAGEEQARDTAARAGIDPAKRASVQPFSGTYFDKGQQKSIYTKPLSVDELIVDYGEPSTKIFGNVVKSANKPLDINDIPLD